MSNEGITELFLLLPLFPFFWLSRRPRWFCQRRIATRTVLRWQRWQSKRTSTTSSRQATSRQFITWCHSAT